MAADADLFLPPQRGELEEMLARATAGDVRRAISARRLSLADLAALLSPAADGMIAEIAARSAFLTRQRFGRVIQLYAPLYLSNYCINRCAYCGFSAENRVGRRLLSLDEAEREAACLAGRGLAHILLVSGEAPARLGTDYLAELAARLKDRFASVSIEVQPMGEEDYARLFRAGITGVAVYQETYDPGLYAELHLSGPKRDMENRLATPARAAAAGMREVGIGVLLGLADWRLDGLWLGAHLAWLRHRFWRTGFTVSFPRLRPAAGGFAPLNDVGEKELARLMFAMRIFDPDVGIVLSTREDPGFRDGMMGLAPTRYSAGSCTAPGGYSLAGESGEQFSIGDERSVDEVCAAIRGRGLDPVRKDWDACFQAVA